MSINHDELCMEFLDEIEQLKSEISDLKAKALDKEKLIDFIRTSDYGPVKKYDNVDMILRKIINGAFDLEEKN